MKRRRGEHIPLWLVLMLMGLALWAVTGCRGGESPTAVALPTAETHSWHVSGATEAEGAQLLPLWADVSACVGVDSTLPYEAYMVVSPDTFYCGGVEAAGCFYPPATTKVVRTWYHEALQHELVHFALWIKTSGRGDTWADHSDPAFARCDNALNFGRSVDGPSRVEVK